MTGWQKWSAVGAAALVAACLMTGPAAVSAAPITCLNNGGLGTATLCEVQLDIGNVGGGGLGDVFPSTTIYASGQITWNAGDPDTAHVSFTGLSTVLNGVTYQFGLGDMALNVSPTNAALVSVANPDPVGSFNGSSIGTGIGNNAATGQQMDGFGRFDVYADFDNGAPGIPTIEFDLILAGGASWGGANNVLFLNGAGGDGDHSAASHIYAVGSNGQTVTGFAAWPGPCDVTSPPSTCPTQVPEPWALGLIGLGLVGLSVVRRRRK